jgi:branched-chain amino acid transport system substrate-binding protein
MTRISEKIPNGLRSVLNLFLLAGMLAGCTDHSPLQIGFVGGISGRVSDLGIAGRNGAILAIEERNQAGGIDGRQVELIIRDDQQNADIARQQVKALIDLKVEAIIGHMTSSMSEASLPLINEAKMVMVSPTTTAPLFSDRDDYFFRVIESTRSYAEKAADYQFNTLGRRRIAVVLDEGNRTYTESWLNDFSQAFQKKGGVIVYEARFSSSLTVPFPDIAEQLLASKADAVLIIANSVDAAMLSQHLRRLDSRIPLLAAEWAATERLVELGAGAVEGMVLAQFIDRQSRKTAYLAFHAAYLKRFNQSPGFAGVTGYDAARVVLDALAGRKPNQSLKDSILSIRRFSGASAPIEINETGDARRDSYLTVIRDGQFRTLEER